MRHLVLANNSCGRVRAWAKQAAAAFVVAGVAFSGTQAHAAPGDQIGSALSIINLVTAELSRDRRELQTGDNVRQDETIDVSADGSGELQLKDETKLALGPGSRILLDKFVYDAEKTNGSIVLNLVKGSFRFVTGIAKKPSYVIRTPTASITVRGTIFDVFVALSGRTWLLLVDGGLRTCNDRGLCNILDQPGMFIEVTEGGEVGKPVKWASLADGQDVAFANAFPFIVRPPTFDPNPIFTEEVIINGNFPGRPDKSEPKRDKKAEETPGRSKTKKASTRDRETSKRARQVNSSRRRSSDDEAILKGLSIGIGIGIGISGGRRGNHGGEHRSPNSTHVK